jgi:hypothetical protein
MADPEERTPADRIDATRQAARSVMLLLEAIERGELAATPLEIARLRAAAEALKDRRLRAELAEALGYYPASLAPDDVARYREQIAKRKALKEAGERDGWEPGGYKWHKWDHLREEKQRAEVEARGRADVADLYE